MTNFLSAFYTKEHVLVYSLAAIAGNYLGGWFIFDAISGVPFSLFMQEESSNVGAVANLAKAPRLYKITKLAKLFRIFKVFKKKSFFGAVPSTDYLPGTARFISSMFITITVIHVIR